MRPLKWFLVYIAGVAVGLFTLGTADAAVVSMQEPTAIVSQSSYPVDYAIDANLATGWGNWDGSTSPANIGAFETVADVGFTGGTVLTFTLDHRSGAPKHLLGKFRLSATTDDRAYFADGLANGGDVAANWVQLVPLSAVSSNSATLTINPDDSILASGADLTNATYTVKAIAPVRAITGFRIEALEDSSLPGNGPGRSDTWGNFALTNFTVDAKETLQNATATYSQTPPTFSVGKIIDDSQTTAWAINRGGNDSRAETAAFETVADVGFSSGTVLSFTLDHQLNATYGDWYSTGKFRLSVTTADRSVFADGLDTGGNVGASSIWQPLQPLSAVSSRSNPFTINSLSGTVLASGTDAGNETYTITATTSLTGITGVRLEVMEDPSLPGSGPGRSPNGNLVLSDFQVGATRLLQNATATYSQQHSPTAPFFIRA